MRASSLFGRLAPCCRDEQKELVAVPTAVSTDGRGVLENDEIKSDIHQCPADAANALQHKVGPKGHVSNETVASKSKKNLPVLCSVGSGIVLHFQPPNPL